MGGVRVRILGPVDVVAEDGSPAAALSPKERRLLAVLAVRAGAAVSEDRLLDALWGDDPPASGVRTVRSYLSRLRRAGLPIDAAESGYLLRADPEMFDTSEVEALAVAARAARAGGDLGRAATLLRRADAAWRGPSFGELGAEPFALAEATRLDELRLTLLEERVEVELDAGHHQELVAELEALTIAHPLRERLWAGRVLALYRSGRQADALRAYQQLRSNLLDLGIDPSPELRALEDAVLRQDPSLQAPAPAPGSGPLPTGVVTFLLTDIEGSTRLWETDPAAMAEALERHDAIVRRAVEEHRGTVVKTKGEGDSTFSVFTRTSDAAGAARRLRRLLAAEDWPTNAPLRVRSAIHMGEAVERAGDYFGPAVNRVARLRALASGGEVLVSQAAAHLLLDHVGGEWGLTEVGERRLKDLDRPERVYALVDDAAPALDPAVAVARIATPPLASALGRDDPCLGRDEELARLHTYWDKAGDGARLAVLVSGEPGIGKTALAAAFARSVHAQGGLVLHGRCDEDLGAPYQPFVESLRALLAVVPDARLRGLGRHAAQLMRLLPEIADRVPGLAPPLRADADAERMTLFEAVAVLLREASADAPVLLVLDDLHWAAKPTLLLLRHLLRADEPMRLLVVGTYRDTEIDRSHPFADVLADLRRDVTVQRLALTGLDLHSVENLLTVAAGHELDGPGLELAHALHRETGGNPFFVGEVLRHLAESGAVFQDDDGRWTSTLSVDELGLPEGVRDVIGRRLSRLSEVANAALSAAAVAGASFSLRLLEAVPEAGNPAELLGALEEAVDAGLLTEDRGTFAFAHALVRQTLLEELRSTRRVRLHRRIGEAIEATGAIDTKLEALAFHFAEAAADGSAAKAADYALAAARANLARAAHEEAIAQLQRGLDAVELEDPVDRARRCDLLLELAQVHRWLSRTSATNMALVRRAAADARAIGSPERLARAAALGIYPSVGTPDVEGVALVEEALAALPEDELIHRTELLAFLAVHRRESEGRPEDGEALLDQAIELSRRLEESELGAVARTGLVGGLGGLTRQLLDFADAVFAMPVEARTAEFLAVAHQARAIDGFRHNDVGVFDAEIAAIERLASETRGWEPTYISLAFRITRALMVGRWDDASSLSDQLLEHAGDNPNALNVWAGGQCLLAWETDRVGDLVPLLEEAAAANPGVVAYRTGLALFLSDLGRLDDARAHLARLAPDRFAAVPRDQTFPFAIGLLTEAAARLGEVEGCEILLELLEPYAGEPASVIGTLCVGAVDRFRGIALTALGRHEEAETCFEAALEQEVSLDAPAYLVRTRAWYGRMLLERDGPGDRTRAEHLLQESGADAARLGMGRVATRIVGLP